MDQSAARAGAASVELDVPMTPQRIIGAHYNMPGLSDIERILVVSDGTFTYQMETFVREPIGVEILANNLTALSSQDATLLDCGGRQASLGSSDVATRQAKRCCLLLRHFPDQ